MEYPKWLWWVLAVAFGLLVSCGLLAGALGVGGEMLEELSSTEDIRVIIFTQPGDPGTEVLRPRIEALRFDYPWVAFEYIDATTEEGKKLAEQHGIVETPTTVLAKSEKEVWTWVGSVEGLEELLELNKALGRERILAGNIPFLGPAGELPRVTFAGVYGALCNTKGTLGTLGKGLTYPVGSGSPAPSCTAEGALEITKRWGSWVKEHNGGKPVVGVLMPTVRESNTALIEGIIAETGRRNSQGEHWYVMLDLQGASEFGPALERWVTSQTPHVGFVLDIEWFGYPVAVSSINQMAEQYFARRESLGLKGLGILGVWYFNPATLITDQPVTRDWELDSDLQSSYSTGIVVPIMDAYGSASAKLATYNSMMQKFQARWGGMMSFVWRWGHRYDSCYPGDIFRSNQLFWTQQ